MLYAKNMHNIFLYCGQPEYLGNFLLFVGQGQLGENYLSYSHIWGSQLHIWDIQTPPKNIMYAIISARMLLHINHNEGEYIIVAVI